MSAKYKSYLVRVAFFLVFAGAFAAVYFAWPEKIGQQNNFQSATATAPESSRTAAPPPLPAGETVSATVSILGKSYPVTIDAGATAYDAMGMLAAQKKVSFSAKEYPGMGYLIEEINGQKNDNAAGMYWIYYINGESATTGVSGYILQNGDKIEWKYEKSKF